MGVGQGQPGKEGAEFYTDLATRMDKPWVRKIFEEYAEEERGHKRKLLAIKEGKLHFELEYDDTIQSAN